jgi:hypothetical protein
MEFIEIFDREKLKHILDNFDYFYDKIGTFKDASNGYTVISNKKTVFTILTNLLNNESIKYFNSKKDISKKGRLYGSNSLQSVTRIIRHTLCKDLCIDIDIVNAHNVLLQHLLNKHNIEHVFIKYYNENRDELLLELMEMYDIDRDEAKTICLSIVNGGGGGWFKKWGISPPEWLIEFQQEIKIIHKKIAKLEPLRFQKSKIDNPSNPYGTCLNTILCELENFVLSSMIEYCNLKGIKISTLCFDGLLLGKCDLNVKEMNDFIVKHTGIDVKILIKQMNEGISTIIKSNMNKSNETYVNPDVFNCEEKVVIVKAGLGTGKTTASIAYINSNKDNFDKIIITTPRITYAKSIFDRLKTESVFDDWVLYNDKKTSFNIKDKHVVIQCESLHRCDFEDERTLVIIDEVESFLTSLTSTKTQKKHHELNLSLFEYLVNSTKVICMDAFISTKTLNIFKSLNIPYYYIHYTQKPKERQYIQIKVEDKDEDEFDKWSSYVLNEISLGKKMYVFISSKGKLMEFKTRLENHTNIKFLYYTSDHKEKIDNVNELWSSVDVILTTSTITVGVNYDVKNHFHSLGVYVSAKSKNLIRDVFQSLYRVRHLIDNLLIFCINKNHYGMNEHTNPIYEKQIKDRLNAETSLYIENYESLHKKKFVSNNFSWLENLVINNILEANQSIMMLENIFFHYLNECNYVECDVMNDEEFTYLSDEQLSKTMDYSYDDIPSISTNDMRELKMKEIKDDLDLLKIEKYFFQQSVLEVNPDDEVILWVLYSRFGRNKFRNLRYEKAIVKETLNMKNVIDTTLPLIADKMGIQLNTIQKISSWFNLDHSQQVNKDIPHETLKQLIPIFKENIQEIYTAFNLRPTRSKSNMNDEWTIRKVTTITNSVLEKWGYTKIKKKSPEYKGSRRKGESIDIAPYQIINVTEVKDGIGSVFPLKEDFNVYDKIKNKNYVTGHQRLLKR